MAAIRVAQAASQKVALLTGAGSGITLAFAKLAHDAGYHIVIADIKLHAQARSWIDEVKKSESGPRIIFQTVDVTKRADLEAAFDRCQAEFGICPTLVVPGAGVYEPSSYSFWSDSDPDSDGYKILDINLVHPIKTTRIAIRRMLAANKAGTIVHISSIAGQRSSIITPLYTISKHGINSLVRGMAALQDLINIRVVGVAPGTVGTPLFTEHPEAMRYLDPIKDHLLQPESIAAAMMALVEDRTTYPAGTILEVCHPTQWRPVSLLNDPGPQGPASLTSRKQEAVDQIRSILSDEVSSTCD